MQGHAELLEFRCSEPVPKRVEWLGIA
jgi:hypothetical protein